MNCKVVLLCLSLLCLPLPASAVLYEVGPDKPYLNIGDVPWENMQAGDRVLIYWRAQPYVEKWVIAVQATQQQPFTVSGVPNASGQLPVIDGNGATTRSSLNFCCSGQTAPPAPLFADSRDLQSGLTNAAA